MKPFFTNKYCQEKDQGKFRTSGTIKGEKRAFLTKFLDLYPDNRDK